MIDQLLNVSGNFRDLLALAGQNEVDLSGADWGNQFVVVRGISFDHMKIVRTKFVADFVECAFDECAFEELVSNGHFSGAGNEWRESCFVRCRLSDFIAPQTRFRNCRFTDTKIDRFRLCQTVFVGCTFSGVSVKGLLTRRIGDKSLLLPELVQLDASALFAKCRLVDSTFTGCNFGKVCFNNCEVENTQFEHCSFEDVIGGDEWLKHVKSRDPFVGFLDAAIRGVERRLGNHSKAAKALSKYKAEYEANRAISRDYSKVLYDEDVPDDELDVVEKILDDVFRTYPS